MKYLIRLKPFHRNMCGNYEYFKMSDDNNIASFKCKMKSLNNSMNRNLQVG